MKRIVTIFCLSVVSLAGMAQSSEAGYPVGTWQSNPDADVFVDITIERMESPNPNFGNKKACGVLSIDGNPSYEAMLTYSGRGLDKDGMPVNIFYFDVQTKNNKTSRIAIQKKAKEENEFGNGTKIRIVKVTGDLENNSALKQQLYSVGSGNGAAYDPTPLAVTDKDLMEALQEAIANGSVIHGFGNVRQYISAHAKLDPAKPKYAKCKGTGSINIRKTGDAKAEKIAELKPGVTLLVVDELDGWCQVRLKEKQYGWVSLSVVTLTNTPSDISSVADATTSASSGTASQDVKNPIVGSWWYDSHYQLELTLKETAKKGNFIYDDKTICLGGLAVSEYHEYFLTLNMQLKQKISDSEAEYSVWGEDLRKKSKSVKGTIRLKKTNGKLLITGTESNGKKWPFDGFYLNENK